MNLQHRIKNLTWLGALIGMGLASCGPSAPSVTAAPPLAEEATEAAVVKGFGISPQGFPVDYSKFPEFLQEVGEMPNGGVMFNGAWREDVEGGSDAGSIPRTAITTVEQSEVYGYTPIVVFGWRTEEAQHIGVPANPTDDWTNQEARALFLEMLVKFAETHEPPYLFLGNESDAYFTMHPEDYARWVEFYNEAYDAVKTISPRTMVGPIFQYERISGQGVFSRWTEPQWGALEAHDLGRVDIVGITLYPWLSVPTPEEVPGDYLAPLLERIGDKPVAITETGWPGDPQGIELAWEASPDAQVRYIAALNRILGEVDLRILNWLHLYPLARTEDNLQAWQSFGSVALRDAAGNQMPIYELWVAYQP